MKEKAITALLTTTMLVGLTACGSATPTASDITNNRGKKLEVEADDTEEEAADEESEETEVEEIEETQETQKATGVVLGSSEASGYTGFQYLMEELVSTSKTNSGEKASFSVYVPDDDYPYVSGAAASSSRMGVDFKIDMEPYLQYKAEDYTLKENLEEYVESQMSYSTYYYGIVTGEVEEVAKDAVSCEVSYMEYSTYDDEYTPVYGQYYLREMDNGIYALATITINSEETTGKTAELLGELSDFYQFDINWDESFTEAKRAEFESSDEYNADAFNLGFMSFELPEGWDKDDDESSYNEYTFAPNGNYALADVAITVAKEYSSDNIPDTLLSDEEYTKGYFKNEFGDILDDISIEDMGETFIGRTAKITISAYGGTSTLTYYIGQVDYDAYVIYVYTWEDASADDAVDMLFETGKIKQ